MKTPIFSIIVLFVYTINAQVGIGTTAPRAALEIYNADKGGLLIPQYQLTGNNDTTTVLNPQPASALFRGTLVFNTVAVTGANAIGVGFVYWDGNLWQRIATHKDSVYGEIYNANNYDNINAGTPLVLSTNGVSKGVTLKNNAIVTNDIGVYRITYTVSMEQKSSGGSEEVIFFVTQNSVEVPGSKLYLDVSVNPDYVTATKTKYIRTTAVNQSFSIHPNQSNNNVRVLSGSSILVELID